MARKLRIAVSVFFGLLTVALTVFWAINYTHWEGVSTPLFSWLFLLTAAAIPWVKPHPQFSLRNLLIVTTLVAAVLGLAVWAGR